MGLARVGLVKSVSHRRCACGARFNILLNVSDSHEFERAVAIAGVVRARFS
jgi:hypothetical protein